MKPVLILLSLTASVAFGDWKLVWSDEFDTPGLPDSKKWTYEEGFVRNQEEQYYTKARKENARVEDGCLIIEARKEDFPNPKFVSKDHSSWQRNREKASYTSACLITEGLAQWQYGKIEIKAKLPMGKGAWPAFWMMGVNRSKVGWPTCGEIDIMEYVTSTPKTIYGTCHWLKPGTKRGHASKGFTINTELVSDWHIYGMVWDEKSIAFTFDGKEYGRYDLSAADQASDGSNPFEKPFYLLINLAIGGSWGGKVDPLVFPQRLVVDYVRIYENK